MNGEYKETSSLLESDQEFINICFKENWLHIRHLETQRMTVFSALVAFFAVAIYNAEKFINTSDTIAATVLMLISICISVIALLLTIKWNRTFDKHMEKIKNIVNDYTYSFKQNYSKYIQYTDHTDESVVKKITSMPRTGNLFVTVYLMIMTFLTFRLVQIQSTFLKDAMNNITKLFKESNIEASFKVIGFIILVPVIIFTFRLVIYLLGIFSKTVIKRITNILNSAESSFNSRKKNKGTKK